MTIPRKIVLPILGIVFGCQLMAQPAPTNDESLPTDYLPRDFHVGRREALRQVMPDNSVAVIFAYPTRT
ncbi:MAG: hypothetical protein KA229_12585, partial [Chitinophagaceae bacterium]|nr:hypothetical protein [Chitinophagaceae bacterium]